MATRQSMKVGSSRAKRVAYDEIKRGVQHLEKSIGEIQTGLRDAERQIEADARKRIRSLRKDASHELATLKRNHREVARILGKVSAAAEGSWRQVKRSADTLLADAVNSAAAVVKRLKKAIPR